MVGDGKYCPNYGQCPVSGLACAAAGTCQGAKFYELDPKTGTWVRKPLT